MCSRRRIAASPNVDEVYGFSGLRAGGAVFTRIRNNQGLAGDRNEGVAKPQLLNRTLQRDRHGLARNREPNRDPLLPWDPCFLGVARRVVSRRLGPGHAEKFCGLFLPFEILRSIKIARVLRNLVFPTPFVPPPSATAC